MRTFEHAVSAREANPKPFSITENHNPPIQLEQQKQEKSSKTAEEKLQNAAIRKMQNCHWDSILTDFMG